MTRPKETVLHFLVSDLPESVHGGMPARLLEREVLCLVAGPSSTLVEELFEGVEEEDNPDEELVFDQLPGVLDARRLSIARALFPGSREVDEPSTGVFTGPAEDALAWLRARGATLVPLLEHERIRSELAAALAWLGGPKTTAARTRSRQGKLEQSLGRLDAVRDRVRRELGVVVPEHLAVWHAFYGSLSAKEREGLEQVGGGVVPLGLTELFDQADAPVTDGLDPRLVWRFRRDPAEFFTIAGGISDGEHWGLWYDDPAQPPNWVANNVARDSGETDLVAPTMLRSLADMIVMGLAEDEDEDVEPETLALIAALHGFLDHDDRALDRDGIDRDPPPRERAVGGPAPHLMPGDPRTETRDERAATYAKAMKTKTGRNKKIDGWVDAARAELAKGAPAFAWVMGHELHWLDCDAYRQTSIELLTGAYDALGHGAFSDVARLHAEHRDLEHVPGWRKPDHSTSR